MSAPSVLPAESDPARPVRQLIEAACPEARVEEITPRDPTTARATTRPRRPPGYGVPRRISGGGGPDGSTQKLVLHTSTADAVRPRQAGGSRGGGAARLRHLRIDPGACRGRGRRLADARWSLPVPAGCGRVLSPDHVRGGRRLRRGSAPDREGAARGPRGSGAPRGARQVPHRPPRRRRAPSQAATAARCAIWVGHGEGIFGIIDGYPDDVPGAPPERLSGHRAALRRRGDGSSAARRPAARAARTATSTRFNIVFDEASRLHAARHEPRVPGRSRRRRDRASPSTTSSSRWTRPARGGTASARCGGGSGNVYLGWSGAAGAARRGGAVPRVARARAAPTQVVPRGHGAGEGHAALLRGARLDAPRFDPDDAEEVLRSGGVVWITGLPSSGKSTLAARVHPGAARRGPGELPPRRGRGARRPGPAARLRPARSRRFLRDARAPRALLARQGLIVIVAATAHRRAYRERARALAPRLIEVYVDVAPATCRSAT